MIRTLIVDDEPPAREGIRLRVEGEPDIEIVGEAGDGPSAVRAIRDLTPDLVFLDVQMPGLDGFGVLDALEPEEWPTAIVFVTAFDEHALRAFDTNAIDYVVKPLVDRRFRRALDRARERLRRETAVAHHEALVEFLAEHPISPAAGSPDAGSAGSDSAGLGGDPAEAPLRRISVRVGDRVRLIALADVEFLEAARNYVRLHSGGKSALTREALGALETRLDPDSFARTHRSYIVNLEHVEEIRRLGSDRWTVVMRSGAQVPLSRSYRAHLLDGGG